MTEQTQIAIDEAPQVEANNEAQELQESPEHQEAHNNAPENEGDDSDENVEFPKKAVNALNRKNKTITKLRAQMRELEAKLNEAPSQHKQKEVNPDDFENYGDYINAQVEALVEQRMTQSQTDMQKQHLTQQQEQLRVQRDQYIIDQANEVAQTFTDLPQVWQQNAALLDSLPEQITDIFYSLENAPAAVYTLAKEGKLQDLMYANPALAAYEIVNAQNRGMELLSKPKTRVSQAPAPMEKAKGMAKPNKSIQQLSGRELLDKFAK